MLKAYPWLSAHPHVQPGWDGPNGVYVAAEQLVLGSKTFPGNGVFTRGFSLTAPGSRLPSHWSVPPWLDAAAGGVGMTYHSERSWLGGGTLQAAARGQEFVADIGERQEPREWLAALLEAHA